MKSLRIVLKQKSANYRREETLDNKMTYPLPPLSTVIGALHVACGFKEYKPMNISIQGKYGSMSKKPYTDYCFLNSVMDDRGILLKTGNSEILSKAFVKIASCKKSQGNSFRSEVTIQVHNREMLDEYNALDKVNKEIKEMKEENKKLIDEIKAKKKLISEKKKTLDKKSEQYLELINQEKALKDEEKKLNDKIKQYADENYYIPLSKYRLLTTSLKFYEILHDIELVLHISAEDDVLNTIYENAYNIKSIGRSEDFVDIVDCKIVELKENLDCEIYSMYSAYLGYDDVVGDKVYTKSDNNRMINGTKYYMNKNYTVNEKGQRVFSKKKVIYTSYYFIEETSKNIWIDDDEDKKYIVNLL